MGSVRYFEGSGGEVMAPRGNSKDHRPDLNQMVIGVLIDNKGKVGQFCIVADRGMVSAKNVFNLLNYFFATVQDQLKGQAP